MNDTVSTTTLERMRFPPVPAAHRHANDACFTKLIGYPGADVIRGDPLFAVEASVLAQRQNDLISAAATLKTAKAQVALNDTSEKRQHSLFPGPRRGPEGLAAVPGGPGEGAG